MSARVTPPAHLVVRLPNPLGDAVMATPALRALRTALPDTRITWAGGRMANAALAGLPWRDDVMPIAGNLARGWRAPFRAARMLRRLGADATLLMPNSFSSALAARLARTRTRVGTRLHGRSMLLSHKLDVALDPKTDKLAPRPMTQHYLALVAPFGAVPDGLGTEVRVSAFDQERAAARLGALGQETRVVAISPGAAFGSTKVYPPSRIADAVKALRTTHPCEVIVLCGPGEEQLARETAEAIGSGVISTHERPPDLGELKGLLARADLCLSTDAGPRHLADALGTPTVAWLGPTDPTWSGESPGRIVRHEALPCLGCHLTSCPIELPCMRQLDPELVASAARAELEA